MDFMSILTVVTIVVLTINIIFSLCSGNLIWKITGKRFENLRKYYTISAVLVCLLIITKLIIWPYTFTKIWDYLDPIVSIMLLMALGANLILDWRTKRLKAKG